MKHEVFQEYWKRARLVHKFKLNGKDKIKAVRAVTAACDGTGIINLWIIANWKINDNTWYNTKGDFDRIYLIRDKDGYELNQHWELRKRKVNSLKWYSKNSTEKLIISFQAADTIKTKEYISKSEFKKKRKV